MEGNLWKLFCTAFWEWRRLHNKNLLNFFVEFFGRDLCYTTKTFKTFNKINFELGFALSFHKSTQKDQINQKIKDYVVFVCTLTLAILAVRARSAPPWNCNLGKKNHQNQQKKQIHKIHHLFYLNSESPLLLHIVPLHLDVDQLLHHLEACWLTLCKSLKEFESLISFLKHFPPAMSSKV